MAEDYILVLDAGSSRPRCHLLDRGGMLVGSAAGDWPYVEDAQASSMSRGFDPRLLWPVFPSVVRSCIDGARIAADEIAAVSVTSQRQAVIALDSSHRVVYAGPNLDLRAVFEGAAIDAEMGDRVYRATGHLPSFLLAPAKLRWLQTHEPEAYEDVAWVVTLADWLRFRLTGVLTCETTLAAEAGLLDIHSRTWCCDLLRHMGVAIDEASLVEAGTICGEVTAAASEETGIPQGTPVAVAPADTQCGLLGLGVAQEHQVGVVAGWSAPLQMVTRSPVLSAEARTWAGCFPGGESWVLESSQGDVGNSYRWLADTLFAGAEAPFEEMDSLARAEAVGSDGVTVLLGAQTMNAATVGMSLGGLLFPVPLTFSEVGRGQMVRACLEAIAYGVASNLRQAEAEAGRSGTSVAIGGGMTRSRAWPKIVADVLGEQILLSSTPEVTALGASLCALVALGDFDSIEDAAASVRPRLRALEPDPVRAAEYRDHYGRWSELSSKFQGFGV